MKKEEDGSIKWEETGLNTTRLVLLLEVEPFSNKFQQILLTPKQFKALSDFLWEKLPKIHDPDTLKEYGQIECGGDEYIHLPNDIKDFYEEDDEIWED